jgi:hypothetical protein
VRKNQVVVTRTYEETVRRGVERGMKDGEKDEVKMYLTSFIYQ